MGCSQTSYTPSLHGHPLQRGRNREAAYLPPRGISTTHVNVPAASPCIHRFKWLRPDCSVQFSSVAESCLTLCTPWTAARQASLSITNFQNLLKLMSIESVMPSNHLILCCSLLLLPQSSPASGSFPVSQLFESGGQSTGTSASASVLPVNIQC